MPAVGESVERAWKDPALPKPVRPNGLINSILPKKTQSPVVIRRQPKTTSPVKRVRIKRKTRRRQSITTLQRPKKSKNEGVWWENVGNPVVFAFRDCSNSYATTQVKNGNNSPAATLITTAMKNDCKVEFATMAGVLIGKLGETKSNAMLKELAVTTFLPGVHAVVKAGQNKRSMAAQSVKLKSTHATQIATAKSAMFKCFVDKTDRLSVAKSTNANTIADSVIIGCSHYSDKFFDLLLLNSKARPQIKLQQKNIALNETYRQAIIKRVLLTRGKAQIKTATGATAQ